MRSPAVRGSDRLPSREGPVVLCCLTLSPESGIGQRYEVVAPLDEGGRLDPGDWLRHREACTVTCVHPSGTRREGSLTLTVDRSGGLMWFILYDDAAEDETRQRIAGPSFREGETVYVRDPSSGAMQGFVVGAARGRAVRAGKAKRPRAERRKWLGPRRPGLAEGSRAAR